ncbi:glutathione S-transferase [Actinoplanes sp. OR16]|uniref:DUF952 domain-containing protein n=1 Tax=Actinoplanes sp. OR16 TaxID=946334 RepID=UPI000F6CB045|nr:DUF952 domain-containing protein [Actinoplanes sp. OR16]BBH64405.1 glutathione S-transferase [Actinoplanes sp. OR16]
MIVHICPAADWTSAVEEGFYEGDTLATEGFIHCSPPDWVHVPATLRFRGRTDLVLLEIDPSSLGETVVWEDGVPPSPDGRQFPHVYGRLPVSAVVRVSPYPPLPDGTFPQWEKRATR